MRSRYLVAAIVGVVLATPALSLAAPAEQRPRPPRGVNAREQRLVERIRQGVKGDEIHRATNNDRN